MSDQSTLEGGSESGAEFRQKFEAQQAENRALREVVATQIVAQHDLVKAEDLAGVDVGELTARAAEIQSQRHTEQQQLVVSGLKDLGWSDERIQQEMAGKVPPAPQPVSQMEALGQLGGAPVSHELDTSDMSPRHKIAAGIAQRRAEA